MDANEFTLLTLLAVGGEVQGKTKLQKTVYLLGAMTGTVNDLGYRPWFYGPYSDEVNAAVTWMKTIAAIDQNVSSWGRSDPAGFEVRRYDFRLNEQGMQFAEIKARQNPPLWVALKKAANSLKQAGELNYMGMSVAAKTYFMLGQKHGRATMDELSHVAQQFGWNVTPSQARRAAQYLNKLGLVELT